MIEMHMTHATYEAALKTLAALWSTDVPTWHTYFPFDRTPSWIPTTLWRK